MLLIKLKLIEDNNVKQLKAARQCALVDAKVMMWFKYN